MAESLQATNIDLRTIDPHSTNVLNAVFCILGVAMKITAWGMIAIGAILFCFVAGSYLFTTGAADAGPTNPAAGVDEVGFSYILVGRHPGSRLNTRRTLL